MDDSAAWCHLGVMGAFYNWFTLTVQGLYKKTKGLNEITKVMLPFLLAGVLGFIMPELLGSGHNLIDALTHGELALTSVVFCLSQSLCSLHLFWQWCTWRNIFSASGVRGIYRRYFWNGRNDIFRNEPEYINNFVLLAMAGYFTAIVRAPITGIILILR